MWLIILLWIVVGCVIGLIVEDTIWPSRFGLLVNIVVGAVGALVGGYVNQQVRFGRFGVILLTVLGAVLFLWILRWFGRGKQTKPAESNKTELIPGDSSTAGAFTADAAVTGAAGALAAMALSDAEATETKTNTPPIGLEDALLDIQLPEVKSPTGTPSAGEFPDVNAGLQAAQTAVASQVDDLQAHAEAKLDDQKTDLEAVVPGVQLPDAELPAVRLPDVELPDVNAKSSEVQASVIGQGEEAKAAIEGQLADVKTGLEAVLPGVELPEAKLPDVTLPKVELPDVNAKLADVQADVEDQLGDIKTGIEGQLGDVKADFEAALPDVQLPEAKLPDVELPHVALPDVKAPTVAAGLGAAVLGVAGLSLAGGEQPAATLPEVELPDLHAKLVDIQTGVEGELGEWHADVAGQLDSVQAGFEATVPDVQLPEVALPNVALPDVNAKLADVQTGVEGELGDLKTGIEAQVDEVNADVEAALPAMQFPEAALPDSTSSAVELPTVELPDVSVPAVAVGLSAAALGAAGLDLADSEAPNVTSPSVDLPAGNVKLAEVQTGVEGQQDEWQAGVEASTVTAGVSTSVVDTQVDLTAPDAVLPDADSKVSGGQAASASKVADLPAAMHEPVESTTVDVAAVLPEGQPLTAQLSTSEGAEPVAAFETTQVEPEGASPELQPSDLTTGALATGLGVTALEATILGAESRSAQAETHSTTVLDAPFVSPSDEIAEPGDNNTVEGALPGVELPAWEAAASPEEQVETKVTHGVTPLTPDASTTSLFDAGDDIREGWGELAPMLPDLPSADAPAPIEHAQLVESKASTAGVQPDAPLPDELPASLATQGGGDATGVEAVLPDRQPTEAVTPNPVAEQNQASGATPAVEAQPAISPAVPTPPTEPADVIGAVASAAPVLPSESRTSGPVAVGTANEPKEKPVESSPGENYPDDLTEVLGIGRVYEQKLYQHGIFTFAQLAEADPRLLKQYTDAMDASNVGDWPRQAARLAKKHKREHAYYSGPVPDKFANIPGVSESTEQRLYMLGLFTYEQLAAASVAQVETILTPAQRIAEVNVVPWIAKAAELARKKG